MPSEERIAGMDFGGNFPAPGLDPFPDAVDFEIFRADLAAVLGYWGTAQARTTGQQPRQELTSADPAARAKDAGLQIGQICPALRFCPCGGLQQIQCSAAFDQPSDAPTVSNPPLINLGVRRQLR
jgi:hypothetical protein